jgi:hypothetical protein
MFVFVLESDKRRLHSSIFVLAGDRALSGRVKRRPPADVNAVIPAQVSTMNGIAA